MNAYYVEICRVDNLEADFQQVPHVQFFWKFRKFKENKNIFLDKRSTLL